MGIRPLRVRNLSADLLARLGPQILMPSYTLGDAGVVRLGADRACSVEGMAWNVLLHNCQATPGSSGAPLLIREQEWYTMVGMHSGAIVSAAEEGGASAIIRHSAIGVWAFANALEQLFQHLNSGSDPYDSTALAH